jgi:hypothetical protein
VACGTCAPMGTSTGSSPGGCRTLSNRGVRRAQRLAEEPDPLGRGADTHMSDCRTYAELLIGCEEDRDAPGRARRDAARKEGR